MSDPSLSPRQRDAAARLAAQTIFDRPIAMEAGAGTGKTATLVARIAAWCLGPGWELETSRSKTEKSREVSEIAGRVLDGVVAITFTEDAAAEMAERVARAFFLLEQWQGETDPSDDFPDFEEVRIGEGEERLYGLFRQALPAEAALVRDRSRALLIQIERLRTSTIHAFAGAILSRFPLEAGLHPAYEVDAEKTRIQELVEECTDEILRQAYGRNDEDALGLAAERIGPAEIGAAALKLSSIGVPSKALETDPFDEKRIAGILQDLRELLEDSREDLQILTGVPKRSTAVIRTATTLLSLADSLSAVNRDPAEALATIRAKIIGSITDSEKGALKKWSKGNFGTSPPDGLDTEKMSEAADAIEISISNISHLDPENFNRLRRILLHTLRRVEEEKHRLGIVVFDDLLRGARTLLHQNESIRRRLQSEIRQLLVDEMQDTDPKQAEIVRILTLDSKLPPESSPSLFLVGDPKQSIYGWRKADLAVYEGLVKDIIRAGGRRHELLVNFRSVPAILEEVRRIVEPGMKAEAGLQPPFVGLEACARLAQEPGFFSDEPRRRPIEHWAIAGMGEGGDTTEVLHKINVAEAAEIEAEAVALDIASLHGRGAALSGMCILMRGRGKLPVLLEALRKRGIPYAVGKDSSYFRSREVLEGMALMRLILDPHDPLALVTLLRSPLVGIPDAALLPLWKAGLPSCVAELPAEESLPEATVDLVKEAAAEMKILELAHIRGFEELSGWPEALLSFLGALSRLRRSWQEDPPDRFLERLRLETLVEPLAAARFPGAYRLANIERFLTQMETLLLEGARASELLHWLRRRSREQPEDPSGKPREDAGEAVRVLTIHGAKGLEFEQVWLVQTHAASGGNKSPDNDAGAVDGRMEFLLSGFVTPGYFRLQQRRKGVEDAELIRLIYVAMTRAKQRLVTSGFWKAGGKGEGPILQRMKQRSTEDSSGGEPWPTLEELAGSIEEDARLEQAEALWALPGLDAFGAGFGNPDRVSLEKLDPGSIVISGDEARLGELRESAASRMQRPWLEPVSHEAHRKLSLLIAERIEGGETPEEEALLQRERISRDIATTTGSAIHRLLEHFDFEAGDAELELVRQQEAARIWLENVLTEEKHEAAEKHFDQLVESFHTGKLWERWLEVGPHALARELPVILPPRDDEEGPVGAFAGAIDFLYADPDSGALVVADFKTDNPDSLLPTANAYRSQLEPYAEAVRQALGLERLPRMELWFIAADELVSWELGS